MASFDENGKYIKTNWKAGDKITATKLNKIEESIEAVNDNDISRHVEADARLDALEAKDAAHDKEFINVKNLIADNKAAAELGDYAINSRMQFLEQEIEQSVDEVHNVAETVDARIAQAVTNVNNVANTVDGKIAQAVDNLANTVDGEIAQVQSDMSTQINSVENNMVTLGTQLQNSINDLSNATKYLQSNSSTGYYVLPGGITLQWGSAYIYFDNSYYGNTYVNFPILCPTWIQTYVNVKYLNSDIGSDIILSSVGYEDGIYITAHHYNDLSMSNENSVTVNWFAIGI